MSNDNSQIIKNKPNEELVTPLTLPQQKQLREILEQGLPAAPKPYLAIAEQIGINENSVRRQIEQWQQSGLIRRFGLVVKHRKLGFNANAMVVWDIPDQLVDQIAGQLSAFSEVSLCYRRPRRLPDWPYNLFCMIHGTDRAIVLKQIETIAKQLLTNNHELTEINKEILFSYKAYKQHGARYSKNKTTDMNIKQSMYG